MIQSHTKLRDKDSYLKSMVIGFVHGLAGSAAMVLLARSTVNNVWTGAIHILTFGFGTIIGMFLFTTILGIPFVVSAKKIKVNKTFIQITGGVSTVFGIYYIYNLGIAKELFQLWLQ